MRWGRIPRSLNEATAAEARARWPDATSFRCASPENLARYFFGKNLLRGCEIVAETNTLHVRWSDAAHFYGNFHELLLESGVKIFEVQGTASLLEKAIEPPLLPT